MAKVVSSSLAGSTKWSVREIDQQIERSDNVFRGLMYQGGVCPSHGRSVEFDSPRFQYSLGAHVPRLARLLCTQPGRIRFPSLPLNEALARVLITKYGAC